MNDNRVCKARQVGNMVGLERQSAISTGFSTEIRIDIVVDISYRVFCSS